MNIRARLGRLEREAWKRGVTGQVCRVHYVAVYAQAPGETGPPDIAFEIDIDETMPPGAVIKNYETNYENKKPNEN